MGQLLSEFETVSAVAGVFVARQVQRAFLTAAGQQANGGEEREGQSLHGAVLEISVNCAGVYRPPVTLPMRAAPAWRGAGSICVRIWRACRRHSHRLGLACEIGRAH